MPVQFCAPDGGRKTRLKHVERLTEINKFEKCCFFCLYFENILAMHGHRKVKFSKFYICGKERSENEKEKWCSPN